MKNAMRDVKRVAMGLWLMAMLAGANGAQAKEPIVAIGIAGPGIDRELILQDAGSLNRFADGWWWLIGYRWGSDAVPKPIATMMRPAGPAYTLTRYQQSANGREAFDQLRYYPQAGARGFTFFAGHQVQGYSSEHDGKWFRATEAGDALMREVLEQQRIAVPTVKHAPALDASTQWSLLTQFVRAFNGPMIDSASSCFMAPVG
jgi:hypothetical protein